MTLFKWLIGRARERSTWLGIARLAGAMGVAFSPVQLDAIIAALMAAAGAIAVFTSDEKPK